MGKIQRNKARDVQLLATPRRGFSPQGQIVQQAGQAAEENLFRGQGGEEI